MKSKPCDYCGAIFDAPKKQQKFCSQSCSTRSWQSQRAEAMRTRTEKLCPGCNRVRLLSDFGLDKRSLDGRKSRCQECTRVRAQEWRSGHGESVRRRVRERYHADVERHRTLAAKSRERNRDIYRAKNKVYRERYRSKHLARVLAMQRAHSLQRYREGKLWLTTHPEERRILRCLHTARGRARKFGAVIEKVTWQDIQALYDAQGGRCAYCDCHLNDEYHIEHRQPLARGGSHSLPNICLACETCNRSKQAHTAEEYIERLEAIGKGSRDDGRQPYSVHRDRAEPREDVGEPIRRRTEKASCRSLP